MQHRFRGGRIRLEALLLGCTKNDDDSICYLQFVALQGDL